MANAKKCDRCGSFYEPYSPTKEPRLNAVDEMILTGPWNGNENLIKRWELCPTCAAYLHAVLRIEPIKEIGGGDH